MLFVVRWTSGSYRLPLAATAAWLRVVKVPDRDLQDGIPVPPMTLSVEWKIPRKEGYEEIPFTEAEVYQFLDTVASSRDTGAQKAASATGC